MDLLNHNAEGISVHFTEAELLHLLFQVQEGRPALNCCANPTGEALDDRLKEDLSLDIRWIISLSKEHPQLSDTGLI